MAETTEDVKTTEDAKTTQAAPPIPGASASITKPRGQEFILDEDFAGIAAQLGADKTEVVWTLADGEDGTHTLTGTIA